MIDDNGESLELGDDDASLESDDAVEVIEAESEEEQLDDQPETGEALAAVREQSAASKRIQQEIAKRKKLEAENEEYRRHILDMQRREAVTKPITEDPDEERRRLEYMDEPQRVQYLVDKGVRNYQTDVRRLELQMNINADKVGFSSFVASNPQFKKYVDEVESEFNRALQNGNPRNRGDILTSIIGNEVIKKGSVALSKAKQIGLDNLRRQQTRHTTTRSGVSGTRRSETAEETLKRRLAQGEYT